MKNEVLNNSNMFSNLHMFHSELGTDLDSELFYKVSIRNEYVELNVIFYEELNFDN